MTKKLQFKGLDSNGNRLYTCPLCSNRMKVQKNLFYGKCEICQATIIDYTPMPHQVNFHKSNAQYKLNIGGFGSGKTTASCAEISDHILTTPNGATVVMAQTVQQTMNTVMKELLKFIPEWLIERKTASPPHIYMKNGHEIMVYASDDEEKLRSLSLTAFYIEEASKVEYEVFTQLQSRLRSNAGMIHNEDGSITYKYLGIVSTNPDDGWVRTEFLLRSGKIFASESIDKSVYEGLRPVKREKFYHSFLSSSRDNIMLPPTFIERLCAGKPLSWVRKYIDCYLDVKEGAVYPEYSSCLVNPFPVPPKWLRSFGFDKGYRDPTVLWCTAIDPATGIVYAYDEYYVAEQTITTHAQALIPYVVPYKLFNNIQSDPSIINRNERDGESYQSYFHRACDNRLYLEPGNNDLLAGIEKVRDYMVAGKLKIFRTLENTTKEASSYLWKESKTGKETPEARNNHAMDAMRYLVMALPDDPHELQGLVYKMNDSHIRTFYKGEWEDDDGTYTAGGVTILQGGINENGRERNEPYNANDNRHFGGQRYLK